MRLTHLLLTCCLLVSVIASLSLVSAQDESASATGSMASVSSFISTPAPGKHHDHHDDGGNKIKINKDIDIEAKKDIIVNVGKVDIDIEIEKQKKHDLTIAGATFAQEEGSSAAVSSVISNIPSGVIGGGLFHDDGNKIKINKEIDIEAKDIIVNVGKVDVDIDIEKKKQKNHGGGLELAGDAAEEEDDELQVSAAGGKDDHHNKHHDDDGNKIKINKDIDIEAKDIIVNVGKVDVDIDIEKKKQKKHDLVLTGAAAADDVGDELQVSAARGKDDHHKKHHDDDGNKIKINKDIDIEAKDIIVNIGKVKVDIDIEKKATTKPPTTKPPTTKPPTTKPPTGKPTKKPTWKPTWKPKATHFEKKMNQILGDADPSNSQPLA